MNRHTLTLKPRTQRTSEVSNGQWFLKNELDTMLGCWKKATGTLVYDPERYDFKKTHKAHTLIIELPRDDLDLYYQWHLRKKLGSWFDHDLRHQTIFNEAQTAKKTITENIPLINRPMFGLHVTVVRGDEYRKTRSDLWGILRKGHQITFEYNPTQLRKRWQFWSIPVRSEEMQRLRRELGLKNWADLHITIARESEFLL